jgi:Winged helix-turn helix
MAMFLNLLNRWESAELIQAKAAELLGVSERTFRRWRDRYDEDGAAGLIGSARRRGGGFRSTGRKKWSGFIASATRVLRSSIPRASGEGPWFRLGLHLVEAASAVDGGRGPGAAQRRPSQEARAASPAGDDAASGRLAARLARGRTRARPDRDARRCDGGDLFGVPGRRGRHSLNLPGAQRGVLAAWPADEPLCGSRFALFPHDQGRRDRPRLSDPGRPGVAQLGVEPIGASSPQARGRSERAFGTLQIVWSRNSGSPGSRRSRRPMLSSATSICQPTTPALRLSRPARARPSPIPGVDLDEILCVEEERQVGNDNCVSYRTLKLQIPESPMRPHFVRARVKVHVYPDGSHVVFHGPRCIGRYDERGRLKDEGPVQRAV